MPHSPTRHRRRRSRSKRRAACRRRHAIRWSACAAATMPRTRTISSTARTTARSAAIAYAIFEPADASTPLLVDRGFVAGRRAADTPRTFRRCRAGEQQLSALYAPAPGSGLRLGGNPLPRQQTWPKESIYLDVGEIAADAGRPLDAKILLLAPEPASGFVREWRPDVFPPERHRGYAFTWFTLAAIVVRRIHRHALAQRIIDMTPQNRKRLGLVLIVLLFATPIVTAYLLNAVGWRPSGMRNYGTLIEPPQDLTAARFMLDDGKRARLEGRRLVVHADRAAGPRLRGKMPRAHRRAAPRAAHAEPELRIACASSCSMRTVPASAIESMKPIERARDIDEKLAAFRPRERRRCRGRARRSARIPDPELSGRATTATSCRRISRG